MSPVVIKYIKAIPTIIVTKRDNVFPIEYIKSEMRESVKGSKIAEASFKTSEKTTIWTIGETIEANIRISPLAPTAFLISMLEAMITSKPSDKYPPKRGT